VQVEEVNVAESGHQLLAHPAKGGVVQIPVIGDEGQHAFAGLGDAPLPEADELHIIVLQPLGIALAERLAVHEVVIADEVADPVAAVAAVPAVGRVAEHDHDRLGALNGLGGAGFLADEAGQAERGLLWLDLGLQGVGQVDAQALPAAEGVAEVLQGDAQLHVRHRVGRDE